EHARPREGFALNQSIEKLRLIARAAIGGQIEIGLGLSSFAVALRNLLLQLRDLTAISSRLAPVIDRDAEKKQCQRRQDAHTQSPAHPEFTSILVGVSREIDI